MSPAVLPLSQTDTFLNATAAAATLSEQAAPKTQ